jgi:hypothetical protein
MHKNLSPLAAAPLAALFALAACGDSEPEIVGGMADPIADELEALEPAELPPMRTRQASFRCADNSLVYVSFYTNNSQVSIADEQNAVQTILANEAVPAEGEEAVGETPTGPASFAGEGYRVIGTGDTIQVARPGGGLQSCSA